MSKPSFWIDREWATKVHCEVDLVVVPIPGAKTDGPYGDWVYTAGAVCVLPKNAAQQLGHAKQQEQH